MRFSHQREEQSCTVSRRHQEQSAIHTRFTRTIRVHAAAERSIRSAAERINNITVIMKAHPECRVVWMCFILKDIWRKKDGWRIRSR